jgi:tight adherence protein C
MIDIAGIVGSNQGLVVSTLIFLAGTLFFLAVAFYVVPLIQTQGRVDRELSAMGLGNRRSMGAQAQLRKMAIHRPVDAYFKAVERSGSRPDAIEKRLFEAGFYGRRALVLYSISRIAIVAVSFVAVFSVGNALLPAGIPLRMVIIFVVSLLFSLGTIVIPSIALDFYARGVKESLRRAFPDFMDMMITCADAGMSLEAAVERVSSEFSASHPHLGVQLNILTLQLRAGKLLRDALHELADRIALDEARTLAVLFRQSEELGTSLVDALRVYSSEMRTQRVLRAEEKANSLPVRMVLPLGLCVFPVVMMIVMLPVILRMKGTFF